jgi:hypothetical protein
MTIRSLLSITFQNLLRTKPNPAVAEAYIKNMDKALGIWVIKNDGINTVIHIIKVRSPVAAA